MPKHVLNAVYRANKPITEKDFWIHGGDYKGEVHNEYEGVVPKGKVTHWLETTDEDVKNKRAEREGKFDITKFVDGITVTQLKP